jgi:hypothetical protein
MSEAAGTVAGGVAEVMAGIFADPHKGAGGMPRGATWHHSIR